MKTAVGSILASLLIIGTIVPDASACGPRKASVSRTSGSQRVVTRRVISRRVISRRVVRRGAARPVIARRPVVVERPVVVARTGCAPVSRRLVQQRVVVEETSVRVRHRGLIPKIYALLFGG